MATYLELRNLFDDGGMRNKTAVALTIAAEDLLSGTPDDDDRAWASAVRAGNSSESRKALAGIIAVNKAASVAAILGATDAVLQAQVDALVPDLVDAFALEQAFAISVGGGV